MQHLLNNINPRKMFKKFFSLLVSTAVLATMTAASVSAAPAFDVIVSASPSSFNPATQTTTITVNVNDNVQELYAYVLYPNYQLYILSNHVSMPTGIRTFNWTGREGNSAAGNVLPNGKYVVKVFAANNDVNVGVAETVIELSSSTVTPPGTTAPQITNLKVNPLSFVSGQTSTDISFTVSDNANLTVSVKKSQVSGSSYATVYVSPQYNNTYRNAGSYVVSWNGKNDDGIFVAAGTYQVEVKATNANGSDVETTNLSITDKIITPPQSDIIKNFTLDPSTTWDPGDDVLQIEFDLVKEVDSLEIIAEKGGVDVEIMDDENLDDDDYEAEWDGTDEDGDYVSGGVWNIIITADGSSVSLPITIVYEQPSISSAFVTKESFDPSKDEYTTLVYKVGTASDVTVEVYDGTHREITLLEDESVSKNKWYSVKFDGNDDDGDELDNGSDYKFKITAKNTTDDSVESVQYVNFEIDEDEVSSGKANVTNDVLEPAIFDDDNSSSLELGYCIDEDSDVFVGIYKGTSAGSNAKIELLDYVAQSAGCHTVSWNGKDKNNKKLDDGMYTYKVISRTENSKKDNEIGKFVVGTEGGVVTPGPGPKPQPGEYDCGMYYDMYSQYDTELCDAVGWATARGIVHGYPNGSFKPYQNITRAEVLKVVLEAFKSMLLPADGTTLGFKDLNPYGWYMTYLRTAQFYGMLEGYEDGTARPEKNINRVEALKFVLEAGETFSGQLLTGDTVSYADVGYGEWYAKYVGAAYTYQLFDTTYYGNRAYLHPEQLVQRGEVALMLYRLNKAGFLK